MKKVLFKKFAVAMAEKFGLTLDEMFAVNREHDVVQARWMLYYLCVERKISDGKIGKTDLPESKCDTGSKKPKE